MPYKDPDKQREYQRKWLQKRRQEWLEENGPCIDCGCWDDLEVDHIDPELKDTHRIWSWTKERRDAELAKCVPRCKPCHLQKTVVEHAERNRALAAGRYTPRPTINGHRYGELPRRLSVREGAA